MKLWCNQISKTFLQNISINTESEVAWDHGSCSQTTNIADENQSAMTHVEMFMDEVMSCTLYIVA